MAYMYVEERHHQIGSIRRREVVGLNDIDSRTHEITVCQGYTFWPRRKASINFQVKQQLTFTFQLCLMYGAGVLHPLAVGPLLP
jgi:hypothetical protein